MTALARYDTIFAADSPMDGAYSTRAEPNCDNASFADSISCGMLSANPERTSASNATPVLQSNPVFSIRAEPRDVTISTPAEAIFGRLLFNAVKNDWIMSEATSIKSGAADAAFSTIWAKISPTVVTTSSVRRYQTHPGVAVPCSGLLLQPLSAELPCSHTEKYQAPLILILGL